MLDAGFCSLDYLKTRLIPDGGTEETRWDAALSRLGLAIAGLMQQHCNRVFERTEEAVDTFAARSLSVVLKAYPVEEIASVELKSLDGTLADYAGLYQLDEASGLLEFQALPGADSQRLVVTYTGGFWLDPMDDDTEILDGATGLPADLLEAFIMQCQATAEARSLFRGKALRDPKNKPATATTTLDEGVIEMLRPYRRFAS